MKMPFDNKGGSGVTGKQAGFTLIEVLIAITVFAVGILAIVSMQTTSVGGNAKARCMSDATSWAADRVEILMALDYDDADLDPGAHTAAPNPPGYTISWNITADAPIPNIKTISVTVSNALLLQDVILQFYKIDI